MGILDRIFPADENQAERLFQKGSRSLNRGQFDLALRQFNDALCLDPGHFRTWNGRGIACQELGLEDEAIRCFERALEIDPLFREGLKNIGSSLRKIAAKNKEPLQLLEALRYLNEAIRIDPGYIDALHEKAILLTLIGKKEEALSIFDRIHLQNPAYDFPWALKGKIMFSKGLYKEALECYSKALERDPENVRLMVTQGMVLIHLERYKEALAVLQRATDLDGNFVPGWVQLGRAFRKNRQYGDAIDCFERASALEPRSPVHKKRLADTWYSMGNQSLFQAGRYEQAVLYFTKTTELFPRHIQAWYCMGLSFKKLGHYKDSALCYQETLSIDPTFIDAWYDLASIFNKTGMIDKSVICYNHVIRLDPSHAEARYRAGQAMMTLHKYKEAVNYFNAVLRLDPSHAMAWYSRGEAMKILDKKDEADFCFGRVSEIVGKI